MRKYIALALALTLALALAACGAQTPAPEAQTPSGSSDSSAAAPDTNTDTNTNTDANEETLPDYTYLSEGLDENGGFAGVKASDLVTLPEYKGVTAPDGVFAPDETKVKAELTELLISLGETVKITDRAVEDGDTVNIDYVGSVGGVEFEGGSTNGLGTDVTIGVTNYIDDFLEQLIGHKPGENFDIEVTFPENYGVDNLNGQDAVFNITINYISDADPDAEITDEIAGKAGFSSADELMKAVEDYILRLDKNEFVDSVYSQAEVEKLPESVRLNLEANARFNIEQNYGVDLATYAAYFGTTEEEYLENAIGTAGRSFVTALAIAEAEGLTATDGDIAEAGLESAAQVFGAPYVKRYLLVEEIVPEFIIENAVAG